MWLKKEGTPWNPLEVEMGDKEVPSLCSLRRAHKFYDSNWVIWHLIFWGSASYIFYFFKLSKPAWFKMIEELSVHKIDDTCVGI